MEKDVTFGEMAQTLKANKMDRDRLKCQIDELYCLLEQKGVVMSQCNFCGWLEPASRELNLEKPCALCQELLFVCDCCADDLYNDHYNCFLCRSCIKSGGANRPDQKLSELLTLCVHCEDELLVLDEDAAKAKRCDACEQGQLFRCEKCEEHPKIKSTPLLCEACEKKAEAKKREASDEEELECDRPAKKLREGE
jgi:hypothetical protein